MPMLRCTNEDCDHEWFERSRIAAGADCEECGEPAVVVDEDEQGEPAPEPSLASSAAAHPAHARSAARAALERAGVTSPPVDVHAVARAHGLSARASYGLHGLSARLVGDAIEVNAEEPRVRQRFSVAHEIGHACLHTTHGAGRVAEQEASAFAGELLVPGAMLRAQQIRDASRLRRLFDVSRDVLRIAAETHYVDLTGDV
jgi:hypothetical protein